MKKRYLRSPIQHTLEVIMLLQIMICGGLGGCNFFAILLHCGLTALNLFILGRYGKYEDDNQ